MEDVPRDETGLGFDLILPTGRFYRRTQNFPLAASLMGCTLVCQDEGEILIKAFDHFSSCGQPVDNASIDYYEKSCKD